MSWNNQTGGSNGGGKGGPWGQGPRGSKGGGPSGPNDNDIEEALRAAQDRLKSMFSGGGKRGSRKSGSGGGFSKSNLIILAIGAILLYGYMSAYQVDADEIAVETRFGVPKPDVSQSGLHFAFWPIEKAEKVKVVERQTRVGSAGTGDNREALMLSGDQNIVEVQFTILYFVQDAKSFLFNAKDPEDIVRQVGESAMREIVGRSLAQDIFRDNRAGIAEEVRSIVQNTLDDYEVGIVIKALNIEDVAPPPKVADAFDEVQRAEQDEDKFQEQANLYNNEKLGQARGEAAQILEDAAAYKNRVVEEAKGEAQRFLSVYEQYAKAPEVTRKRLFLETMEGVLRESKKVIMENGEGGTGVVPYLPLPEITPNRRNRNQNQ